MLAAQSRLASCARGCARILRANPVVRRPLNVVALAGKAKSGDSVEVHYTGTLDSGKVFDSSKGRSPLAFTIGTGQVIKGFDIAVTGLSVGESRKSRIEPEDAYGLVDPKAVIVVPAAPGLKSLMSGSKVQLSNGQVATVQKVTDSEITLDLNHELAGKALTFEVELVTLHAAGKLQKAYFGAGCFWSVELIFQRTPGVVHTAVGYCNGTVPEPTYDMVCTGKTGHAEVVEVVFDSEEVSFSQLLDIFWDKHDPTTVDRQGNDVGSQYRSGIYFTTPEQKEEALKSLEKARSRYSAPIITELSAVSMYSAAEEYHQAYLAKGGRNGKAQSPAKGCSDPIRCYG